MIYGVVGTGYWGENHVRVAAELAEEGRIEDAVICDIDEPRVAELASQYGFRYTTDRSELADYGVDAATVATTSPTHRDVAKELLRDGIDLLVEKPLATTSEDARDIVDAAERHGRTLAVGHIFRHHPGLRALKSHLDRGELGDVKYLQTNRFSFRVPRKSAGVLYSLAVHDVDVYRYLLGRRPDWIECRLDRWVREDIDETATIVVGFDDTTGVINESWQIPVFGKRRDLTVVGTERVAFLDYLADNEFEVYDYRIRRRNDEYHPEEEGSTTYEVDNEEPLRVEIEDFIAASADGGSPRATGRVGAETIELLELAEKSDQSGQRVGL